MQGAESMAQRSGQEPSEVSAPVDERATGLGLSQREEGRGVSGLCEGQHVVVLFLRNHAKGE